MKKLKCLVLVAALTAAGMSAWSQDLDMAEGLGHFKTIVDTVILSRPSFSADKEDFRKNASSLNQIVEIWIALCKSSEEWGCSRYITQAMKERLVVYHGILKEIVPYANLVDSGNCTPEDIANAYKLTMWLMMVMSGDAEGLRSTILCELGICQ